MEQKTFYIMIGILLGLISIYRFFDWMFKEHLILSLIIVIVIIVIATIILCWKYL